jgi:hypothetical protein
MFPVRKGEVTGVKARFFILIGLACACGARSASRADTVQTAGDILAGVMSPREGAILIGGATVPLGEVLTAVRDTGANTISAAQAIRMINGEIWCGSILGLETNALTFRGVLFGERMIETEAIATLDFSRLSAPTAAGTRGMLYREKGAPIPGSLLWIRESTLAIDCPLGVLPVPRQGVIRYQFKAPVSAVPRKEEDEVGLIDGSVFRGQLSVVSNGLEMAHASLGTVSVPWAAMRYLLRSSPDVMRLGLPAAGDVEPRGPDAPPPSLRLLDYRSGLEPRQPTSACLTAVRMLPITVARYRLQGREGRKAWFRAVVVPVPECRGDVRIGLQVAGATVYEQTLPCTNAALTVSLELPPGEELTLKTDFGGTLLYPCGVDWQDPCVVFRKE